MPALLVLALVCTVFANVLFYWLIQQTSVVFGSAIAYAIPCMALVWGSLDGERITATHLLGFAMIIGAVYTLRRS
jgi:drug/metabolite transporter (DMT)-like permease